MISKARTVPAYLASLPEDRRSTLKKVRAVILKNLDAGFREGMQYGMIGYFVPHSLYPAGYHCDPRQPLPYAALASQKNHLALYLMCLYCSPEMQAWFRREWATSGKKLDMGKSCIRFKRIEDLPLDTIGKAIGRTTARAYIALIEATLASRKTPRTST